MRLGRAYAANANDGKASCDKLDCLLSEPAVKFGRLCGQLMGFLEQLRRRLRPASANHKLTTFLFAQADHSCICISTSSKVKRCVPVEPMLLVPSGRPSGQKQLIIHQQTLTVTVTCMLYVLVNEALAGDCGVWSSVQ